MTRILVVFCTLFLTYSETVKAAGNDTHATQSDAGSHCNAQAASGAARWAAAIAAQGATGWTATAIACPWTALVQQGSVGFYTAKFKRYYNGVYQSPDVCASQSTSGNCTAAEFDTHYAQAATAPCPTTQVRHYKSWVKTEPWSFSPFSATLCGSSCTYTKDASQPLGTRCVYADANTNGVEDVGETFTCSQMYTGTGASCSGGTAPSTTGPANVFNCQNTDCGANPGPGNTGTSGSAGTPGPGGGGGTGGSGGTAGINGTGGNGGAGGQGGVGGVGGQGGAGGQGGSFDASGLAEALEEAVDCNPLSNPECANIGAGTASGDCGAQPSCTGDPVGCALLAQQWHDMCYLTGGLDVNAGPESWGAAPDLQDMFDAGEVDASTFNLDESGYLAGGSCPDIAAVMTPVGAFAIDGAVFCTVLEWIGLFNMIGASMVSARVLFGGGGVLG